MPEPLALTKAWRRRAVSDPGESVPLLMLARRAQRRSDAEAAARLVRRARALATSSPVFWNNLAQTSRRIGSERDFARTSAAALVLRPDYARVLVRLCRQRSSLGATQADRFADWAVAADPLDAEARIVRAIVAGLSQRPEVAFAECRRGLMIDPADGSGANNVALVLRGRGALAAARRWSDRAFLLHPDDAGVRYNHGTLKLLLGEFEAGWHLFESRERYLVGPADPTRRTARLRRRESVAGRSVLVLSEQGHGDTIQFARYIPLLAALGATVHFAVQPSLVSLLTPLAGAASVFPIGTRDPGADRYCFLMSLPYVLGTAAGGIPCGTPYLTADPERVAQWRSLVDALPGLRVGLVWAGGRREGDRDAAAVDMRRSLPLAALLPLAGCPGVSLVSLQVGPPGAEAAAPPPGMTLVDPTGRLRDFADTAALVAQLDLVVTVDTAVAHLAGALGKPVWVLNRFDTCWRWMTGRADSPWYPTMRLFRQPAPGDWGGAVTALAGALSDLSRVHCK